MKIPEKTRLEIRKLKGSMTRNEVAKEFGIAKGTITGIWSNRKFPNQKYGPPDRMKEKTRQGIFNVYKHPDWLCG